MNSQENLIETNCRVIEREQEDKIDNKTKKLTRVITTKTQCDLIRGQVKRVKGKTLTRETLVRIIREEVDYVIQQVNDRISIDKKAFDTLLNKTNKCLDNVIEDDDDELIDEKCGDETPGNRRHDKEGHFTDKSANTSWSLQKKGCGANKMEPGKNIRKWSKIPCGSVARKQGKNVPCKGKGQ
jgi:hypothetical protein